MKIKGNKNLRRRDVIGGVTFRFFKEPALVDDRTGMGIARNKQRTRDASVQETTQSFADKVPFKALVSQSSKEIK